MNRTITLAAALLLIAAPAALARDMDPGGRANGTCCRSDPVSRGGDGGGGWFEDLSRGQLDQLEKDFKQREKNKGKQSQQGNTGKGYTGNGNGNDPKGFGNTGKVK